jgi:(E)-4-hydroxy-3-methylbut-2-enyl-diphosphate synthase
MGTIKSAIGIGSLLCDGIGDTIRTSLTDQPEQEVALGYQILKCCGLYQEGIDLISCPTCGRCQIDLIAIAQEAERRLADIRTPLKVAIMGCAVNGPGEAKEADIGIAGGVGEALLFKRGEVVRKIEGERIVDELIEEIRKMI